MDSKNTTNNNEKNTLTRSPSADTEIFLKEANELLDLLQKRYGFGSTSDSPSNTKGTIKKAPSDKIEKDLVKLARLDAKLSKIVEEQKDRNGDNSANSSLERVRKYTDILTERMAEEPEKTSPRIKEPITKENSSSVQRPKEPVNDLQLVITGSETFMEEKKPYTVYIVEVRYGTQRWEVKLRYSNFNALNEQLKRELPSVQLPSFPGKRLFGTMTKDTVDKRRKDLDHYAQRLATIPSIRNSDTFKNYFDPNCIIGAPASLPASTSPPSSTSNPSTNDQTDNSNNNSPSTSNSNNSHNNKNTIPTSPSKKDEGTTKGTTSPSLSKKESSATIPPSKDNNNSTINNNSNTNNNDSRPIDTSKHTKEELTNLLFTACFDGDLPQVRELVEKEGVAVHCFKKDPNYEGMMFPLRAACQSGNTELVNYLLSKGANIATRDSLGRTCLHYECIGYRANNNNNNSVTLNYNMIKNLVYQGGDIYSPDEKGVTPYDLVKKIQRQTVFQGVDYKFNSPSFQQWNWDPKHQSWDLDRRT